MARCRELQIAGATVFRGVEGYGETAEIHAISAGFDYGGGYGGNIGRLVPVLAEMIPTGVMAKSAVQMIRVQKTTK